MRNKFHRAAAAEARRRVMLLLSTILPLGGFIIIKRTHVLPSAAVSMSLYWNNKIAGDQQCKGVGFLISAITAPQASGFLCLVRQRTVSFNARNEIGKYGVVLYDLWPMKRQHNAI